MPCLEDFDDAFEDQADPHCGDEKADNSGGASIPNGPNFLVSLSA
jgi:hypothetical protein